MNGEVSTLALALSWCEEERVLLGREARPLSLGSRHLLGMMRARLLDEDPGYAGEEEAREMMLFAWLHTSPLEEVTEAMWTGGWRAVLEAELPDEAVLAEVLVEWRERRLRLAWLVAAAEYEVRPKPRHPSARKGGAAETPPDVIEPTRLAHRLRLLMRDSGASRREALWEWPYWQAVQICHAAQRYEGQWTVPPMVRTGPADFEGFDLGEEDGERGRGGEGENVEFCQEIS